MSAGKAKVKSLVKLSNGDVRMVIQRRDAWGRLRNQQQVTFAKGELERALKNAMVVMPARFEEDS